MNYIREAGLTSITITLYVPVCISPSNSMYIPDGMCCAVHIQFLLI